MIVEKYSKKDETAEAYYQLGFMSLMEDFNLDLAREYFENSKTEKSSSFYARESKELLNKIKVKPLKIISLPAGNIMRALIKKDLKNGIFGEAYFSKIKFGKIKAWKYHLKMTL